MLEIVNLVLRLEGGISYSYAFLGICEAGLPGAGFRSTKLKYFCILLIAISYGNSGKKIQHKISLFFKGVYIINCGID